MADAIEPSEKQIKACKGMGWEFDGVDMFEKGDRVGWFEEWGWDDMTMEEFCNG